MLKNFSFLLCRLVIDNWGSVMVVVVVFGRSIWVIFGIFTEQLCPNVWCALRATCFRPPGGQFLVDRITCRVKLMQLRVAAADPVSQSVNQQHQQHNGRTSFTIQMQCFVDHR
ncbi:hypothetical protein T02_5144 [Trichinella nativa]|uniref:Uncharacterized protein n=1 Tax=Trichinella nativa TaxID=6335 RepID=A0A0V1LUI0_9BILA|nr:hypothetical protein T02_5144 [Trichinella nativa]